MHFLSVLGASRPSYLEHTLQSLRACYELDRWSCVVMIDNAGPEADECERIAALMGGEVMQSYYDEFGLLDRLQIGLAESTAPLIPSRWDANTIASASFGHAIGVTPLQMAAGVGAIMNGGEYVPLTLRPVTDRSGIRGRRVVSPQTSLQMLRLMRLNVTSGSGRRADIEGFSVGGKTGTAEKYTNGRPDRTRVVSSFVSVFPTDGPLEAPRYFVLILLDEPTGGARTGGLVAAPAVGRVIDRSARFLGVPRQMQRPQFDIAAVRGRPNL